jgi:hypothetical protein
MLTPFKGEKFGVNSVSGGEIRRLGGEIRRKLGVVSEGVQGEKFGGTYPDQGEGVENNY